MRLFWEGLIVLTAKDHIVLTYNFRVGRLSCHILSTVTTLSVAKSPHDRSTG